LWRAPEDGSKLLNVLRLESGDAAMAEGRRPFGVIRRHRNVYVITGLGQMADLVKTIGEWVRVHGWTPSMKAMTIAFQRGRARTNAIRHSGPA
jgi:hypothetical protein